MHKELALSLFVTRVSFADYVDIALAPHDDTFGALLFY
jgi:hypothetical protein